MSTFGFVVESVALPGAIASAISFGFFAWRAFDLQRRSWEHKASVAGDAHHALKSTRSLSLSVVRLIESQSRELALTGKRGIVPANLCKSQWFDSNALKAGLEGRADSRGYREAQAKLGLLCAVIGMVIGMIFSPELSAVLAIAGMVIGTQLPSYAIKSQIALRAHETERHLPEMLEVVALGIRSGLSFDSSLHLYAEHFDCSLSRDLANSQRQWSSGLSRREEALRKVAASYDSVVLSRVVETIIRSVRYGSTMAQSLEDDAVEARAAFKARREERVAKAPIKMMIPTGTLILPAMLILVLGPVLLNMMGGGI